MDLLLAGFAVGSSVVMLLENIKHKYTKPETLVLAYLPLVIATCLIINHINQ